MGSGYVSQAYDNEYNRAHKLTNPSSRVQRRMRAPYRESRVVQIAVRY